MIRRILGAAAVSAVAIGLAFSAEAKTLVYCSEGSPEGFNPQLFTAGTTFDASSHPLLDKTVKIQGGTTPPVAPAPAESGEVSDDGLSYTSPLRQGVKFHPTEAFTPSRDFNAEDVV